VVVGHARPERPPVAVPDAHAGIKVSKLTCLMLSFDLGFTRSHQLANCHLPCLPNPQANLLATTSASHHTSALRTGSQNLYLQAVHGPSSCGSVVRHRFAKSPACKLRRARPRRGVSTHACSNAVAWRLWSTKVYKNQRDRNFIEEIVCCCSDSCRSRRLQYVRGPAQHSSSPHSSSLQHCL
jgi:hypothetical protein